MLTLIEFINTLYVVRDITVEDRIYVSSRRAHAIEQATSRGGFHIFVRHCMLD